MTAPNPTDLADDLDCLAESGRWVSIGTSDSHKKILLDRRQLDELRAAADELRRLAAWKAEASAVLAEWDQVHEALGSPGLLGEQKSAASLAAVEDAAIRWTCTYCDTDWATDDLDQDQPDGRYVCPLCIDVETHLIAVPVGAQRSPHLEGER